MSGLVQPEERTRRAVSFSTVAAEYERGRPGYPVEAVRWLLGNTSLDVLDLAAGTGKLTAAVLAAGHFVISVEPLAELRAALSRTLPDVEVREGVAEAIPMPDASVDAVVVGSAFHWFDPSRALPEIARVLCPGGTLGLFGNRIEESEEWIVRYLAIVRGEQHREGDRVEPLDPWFRRVQEREFLHHRILDLPALQALAVSYSHVAMRPAAERDAVKARVARLWSASSATAGPDRRVLRYRTRVRCCVPIG
jgi:SAM-dependent methyltransferase